MKSIYQHCFETLRNTDRDRYFSVLFAPESKRGGLCALYAFNAEIARIRDTIREPLVGEIRLRWWRDAIEAGVSDDTQNNPILLALLQTIDAFDLPKTALLRYCDARIFDLYNDAFPTVHDLEAYCGETASTLLQLACQILDPQAALKSADASGHGGVAQAISGILRLLPITQARGQLFIPVDMMNAVGVEAETLISDNASDQDKTNLSSAMIALAFEHYHIFIKQQSNLARTLRPAFLPLSIIKASLKKAEQAGSKVFLQSATLSPLRRYSLMTKAALMGKLPR